MKVRIIEFIEANGWKETGDSDEDYQTFRKKGCYDIHVGNDETVLLDESGDFLHISNRNTALYALLGVLIHYNQIIMGYNFPGNILS